MRIVTDCYFCVACITNSAIKVHLKIFAVSEEYARKCLAQYSCNVMEQISVTAAIVCCKHSFDKLFKDLDTRC